MYQKWFAFENSFFGFGFSRHRGFARPLPYGLDDAGQPVEAQSVSPEPSRDEESPSPVE
jgi:hypothetical protein